MIRELLAAWWHLSSYSPTGHLQVGAAVVGVTRDEEQLLLQTDVDVQRLHIIAQVLQQALALSVERVEGAQQWHLAVQRVAVVGHQAGGDEYRVSPQEYGRCGVNHYIRPCTVRLAHSSIGEGRAVGLALEKVAGCELPEGLSLAVKLEHRVLHLSTLAMS